MALAHWKWMAAATIGLGAAACSAILGLDAPPAPDAGPSDNTEDAGGDSQSAPDTGPVVCTPLDAGIGDSAATYFPLSPATFDDAGAGNWESFDMTLIPKSGTKAFAGGTYDGQQYVYFAGRTSGVARYDTHASFTDPMSWKGFNVTKIVPSVPGGFAGAVFDGRYVYWIPFEMTGTPMHLIARYDTQGAFDDPLSWTSFDTQTVASGGGMTSGFFGGAFDGRFLYLVPRNNGARDGRVVRYDAKPTGPAADGGPGDFSNLTFWSTFDLASLNPLAVGYSGAVFDGVSVYFVPEINNAYDAGVHGGGNSIAVRLDTGSGFANNPSWSTFDMTIVNGLAFYYTGGAFDGRYVYYAPHTVGVAARFDTKSSQFGSATAWSTYDIDLAITSDAAAPGFSGTAFDGRFVYFIPNGTGFGTVTRYDTQSTFTDDCAWSAVDLAEADAGNLAAQNFNGAVFDGQYVYFIPAAGGLLVRFKAKTPASLPTLPEFYGSFL